MFVSRHYTQKKWTNYERRSVQDRALQQTASYLLPIGLDDTKLPGLPSTVVYLDGRRMAVDSIVDAVTQKLGQSRTPRRSLFNGRTPRTPEEMSLLLQERPFGWEMLLHAAVVHRGTNALAAKYEDHVIGYARSSGAYLDDRQVVETIRGQISVVSEIVQKLLKLVSPEAWARAFGKPGEAGDPDRIVHLAQRLVDGQEELLDWAANLRAVAIHDEHLRRAAHTLARCADESVNALHSFSQELLETADNITARHRAGEQFGVSMTIEFTVPAELVGEVIAELEQYVDSLE